MNTQLQTKSNKAWTQATDDGIWDPKNDWDALTRERLQWFDSKPQAQPVAPAISITNNVNINVNIDQGGKRSNTLPIIVAIVAIVAILVLILMSLSAAAGAMAFGMLLGCTACLSAVYFAASRTRS